MKQFKIYKLRFLAVITLLSVFVACNDEDEFAPVNPKAEFTYKVSDVDPFEIKFTSTITDRDSLRWDFGDGGTSTLAHPTHTFSEEGDYNVMLTAFGEPGSVPTVVDTTITIIKFGPTDTEFSATASTDNPLEVKFKVTSKYARSFAWDFGDGKTAFEQNPTNVYDAAGTYTVTLTVTGLEGTTPVMVTQTVAVGVVLDKLEGEIIGHKSSWNDNPDTYIDAAFDGDLSTFVDAPNSEGFVGYDMGEGNVVTVKLVKYAPREGQTGRMVGGEIRGSNDPTILTDPANATYDVLYTITEEPTAGGFSEADITVTESYRFIYYYSADGYCNVAELEFYGEIPFDGGLINMTNWTEQAVAAGVTVTMSDKTINFSGVGGWSGSHIYQEVTVKAGTYQLSGSVTVNSVIDEVWSELIFSTAQPQPGEDYAPGIPYQVVYSTWNGSPTEPGTYDLKDANKGGEYPEDGLYTFDAPETFYIVIKSGSGQPYDLTWNELSFKKVD